MERKIIERGREIEVSSRECLGRPSDKPGVLVSVKTTNPQTSIYVSLSVREVAALRNLLLDASTESLKSFTDHKEYVRKRKKEGQRAATGLHDQT